MEKSTKCSLSALLVNWGDNSNKVQINIVIVDIKHLLYSDADLNKVQTDNVKEDF